MLHLDNSQVTCSFENCADQIFFREAFLNHVPNRMNAYPVPFYGNETLSYAEANNLKVEL